MVEDVIGNLIEAIFNFALIRVEGYESLSKYLQSYECKFELLSGGGFDVADTKLRDPRLNELIIRGQENSLTCK